MPQMLDYARDPDELLATALRRYGPWLIYFLCWMGWFAAGGMLLGQIVGALSDRQWFVFRNDDFWIEGLKMGVAVGGVIAWLGCRSRQLHRFCTAAGLIGSISVVCALALTWVINGSDPVFWRPTLTVLGLVEAPFLALGMMGGAGIFLNKWLARHPPRAAVPIRPVRVLNLVPDEQGASPQTLDYAPRDRSAPSASTILRAVLRHFLWLIYYLCWMAAGLVGGLALAGGVGVSDGYVGAAGGLGVIVACVIAWRGRKTRWLHMLCIVAGLLGAVAGAWEAAQAFRGPHPFLWQVVVAAWGVVAMAFLALALAGRLGLFLRKSLVKRLPLAPVDLDLVRAMAIAPHQRARSRQTR